MNLDIWVLNFDDAINVKLELETIEAEVVFCVRQHADQWPLAQTEIHFHPSTEIHRQLATRIFEFATGRSH